MRQANINADERSRTKRRKRSRSRSRSRSNPIKVTVWVNAGAGEPAFRHSSTVQRAGEDRYELYVKGGPLGFAGALKDASKSVRVYRYSLGHGNAFFKVPPSKLRAGAQIWVAQWKGDLTLLEARRLEVESLELLRRTKERMATHGRHLKVKVT